MTTVYFTDRNQWRQWLSDNFETSQEVWFIFPMKESGEKSMAYNDAVEEALCFGWIDSTIKHIDPLHRAQRFTARRKGSKYSQPNIERLKLMDSEGKIHPMVRESVKDILEYEFVYPEDILETLRSDETVWQNYQNFTEPYRRIRVAYIEAARKHPVEFNKRLANFIKKTRENKIITGYGGISKFY